MPEWREIQLTKGFTAIVDNRNFEELARHKWCASETRSAAYAVRVAKSETGKMVRIYMHRHVIAAPAGCVVDHRNGNTLDNRSENLRVATASQNQHNSASRSGLSRFKGVSWHQAAGKWQAHISANSIKKYIGLFASEDEAARAYDIAAIEMHGEFAKLNFNS